MRGIQCRADLCRDRDGFGVRDWPSIQAVGQRRSFDQFEDERQMPVRLLQPVNRGDVWMVERCQHPRLALKAAAPLVSNANASGSTFIATSRPSRVSRAR